MWRLEFIFEFNFIFTVSTLTMGIDILYILEADVFLLAAHLVTTHLLDIRSIKKNHDCCFPVKCPIL